MEHDLTSCIEPLETIYSFKGIFYKVIETANVHHMIANDSQFASNYFCQNENLLDIVGFDPDDEPQMMHNLDTQDKENSVDNHTNFSWNEQEIKFLLECYSERHELFRDPKVKNRLLWNRILKEFEKKGYNGLTVDMLDTKFRNLKKTFKHILDNNKKKNTGRGRITWPYFHILFELFKDDRTINIGHTISSINDEKAVTQLNNTPCHVTEVPNSSTAEELPKESTSNSIAPCYPIVEESTSQSTSSFTTRDTARKRARGRKLYEYRQKQLQIEETRVQEIIKLTEAVTNSNKIQERRNELLEKYLLSQQ